MSTQPGTGSQPGSASSTSMNRDCILVAGMHRSGTSAFTRLFALAGATLPDSLVGPRAGNDLGHWESAALVALNDETLAALGSSWCDWHAIDWPSESARDGYVARLAEVIRGEYGAAPLITAKDPRQCRFVGEFLEAASREGLGVRVVIPIRNPLEVCGSLAKRDQMDIADAALLWLRYTLEAEASSRAVPRAVVLYDNLLCDWRTAFDKLSAAIGTAWPVSADEMSGEVAAFIDPGQRHHAASADDLTADRLMSGWMAEAFAAMCALSEDPQDPDACAVLDRISGELERADPFLAALHARVPETEKGLRALKKPPKPVSQRLIEETQRWRRQLGG